jgi:hypothetical protein
MNMLIFSVCIMLSVGIVCPQKALSAPGKIEETKLSNEQAVVLVCKLLEAYYIDEVGYPSSLNELFPAYYNSAEKLSLKSFKYQVDPINKNQEFAKPTYSKYNLIHAGKDGQFATSDDYEIDTLHVLKKPSDSELPEIIAFD